jgi:hypothetical protein
MVQSTGAPAASLRVPAGGAVVVVDAFAGGLARRRAGFVRVRCARAGGSADRFALRDRRHGRSLPLTAAGPRCVTAADALDLRYAPAGVGAGVELARARAGRGPARRPARGAIYLSSPPA